MAKRSRFGAPIKQGGFSSPSQRMAVMAILAAAGLISSAYAAHKVSKQRRAQGKSSLGEHAVAKYHSKKRRVKESFKVKVHEAARKVNFLKDPLSKNWYE